MYKKILLSFIAILFISISAISLRFYDTAKDEYYDETEMRLLEVAELVAKEIKTIEDMRSINGSFFYQEFSTFVNSRLTIIDKFGIVQFDSQADVSELDNHRNRPEIQEALKGNQSMNIRFSDSLNVDMMYVAVPISVNSEIIGVVRTSVDLSSIKM